jgi:DNA-binding NarL/FixJ family response regulator
LPIRILIVDDQEAIRKVLRALIERHAGWQVCGEAENGREAVDRAAELKPDLIIMDLAMPIMDGIRAAREISSAMPTLPILLNTMHSTGDLAFEAKKAGVHEVISKGESGDHLLLTIESLLRPTAPPETTPDAGSHIAQTVFESMSPVIEKSSELATSMGDGDASREPHGTPPLSD